MTIFPGRVTANWHTHTFRCRHASGDAPDYLRAAREAGLETVGFSDHSPLPDGRWGYRMTMREIPGYVSAIRGAREAFPDVRVYAGYECEWLPELGVSFYEDVLLGEGGADYLVGASHYFQVDANGPWNCCWGPLPQYSLPRLLSGYVRYMGDLVGSGLFAFVAHPDLFGLFYHHWTSDAAAAARDIAQAARAAGVPLEINGKGFRNGARVTGVDGAAHFPYPWEDFWGVVAQEGADVIIGSDAHAPEDVAGNFDECLALARRVGARVVVPKVPGDFPAIAARERRRGGAA